MKAGKIKAHNEAHYQAIQERLFELGYLWMGDDGKIINPINVSGTKTPYLFFNEKGEIVRSASLGYFEVNPKKEYTLDDLYSDEFTKDEYFHFNDISEVWKVAVVGKSLSAGVWFRKEIIVKLDYQAELVEEDGYQRIRFKKK